MATGFKTGGRAKGVANKVTRATRSLLQSILETELKSGRVQQELQKLEGADYLNFLLKLSSLVLPKLQTEDPDVEPSRSLPPPIVIVPASFDDLTANKIVGEIEQKYLEMVKRYFPEELPPDG